MALIKLAIEQNQGNLEYVMLLEKQRSISNIHKSKMMKMVGTELCTAMFILFFVLKNHLNNYSRYC